MSAARPSPLVPPQETIRRKRDGGRLEDDEIAALVAGMTTGPGVAAAGWTDAQLSAFAMAVFFRGLDAGEQAALTRGMAASGTVISWEECDLGRPVIDKHSTGGVGDKVSLMLAPMAAAAGLAVPMIAGRALGHTGGTVDKLASIPGYRADPDIDTFKRVVRDVGCAIVGQTSELAPADRRLYGLRDTTATVESIPLITSSILSKKLAAGLDGLVMDVKVGSGAFMTELEEAEALAQNLVAVGRNAGLPVVALLTDMNQVLGWNAGNALEVRETIEFLTGARREPRLEAVTLALVGEMLALGGLAASAQEGEERARRTLADGSAAEIFARMVHALGGPAVILDRPECLPGAAVILPVLPAQPGTVVAIDVRAVGLTVAALGGGRLKPTDDIAPEVGLSAVAGVGEEVGPDRPLAFVHARNEQEARVAISRLEHAFTLAQPLDNGYGKKLASLIRRRIA